MHASGIQPALGGALLALFGNDARSVWTVAQRDLEHFLGRGHLQIDRQGRPRHDRVEIAVADVPPVLAQVDGNAIAARRLDNPYRAHRIGVIPAARVADGGDVVDVDA